jgi:hypothetical protein
VGDLECGWHYLVELKCCGMEAEEVDVWCGVQRGGNAVEIILKSCKTLVCEVSLSILILESI